MAPRGKIIGISKGGNFRVSVDGSGKELSIPADEAMHGYRVGAVVYVADSLGNITHDHSLLQESSDGGQTGVIIQETYSSRGVIDTHWTAAYEEGVVAVDKRSGPPNSYIGDVIRIGNIRRPRNMRWSNDWGAAPPLGPLPETLEERAQEINEKFFQGNGEIGTLVVRNATNVWVVSDSLSPVTDPELAEVRPLYSEVVSVIGAEGVEMGTKVVYGIEPQGRWFKCVPIDN